MQIKKTYKNIVIFVVFIIFTVILSLSAFSYVPNDPLYPQQWHLGKISMQQAWDIKRDYHTDVKIGVIDSGVDLTHEDLENIYGSQYIMHHTSVRSDHGAMVAGVIMANIGNKTDNAGNYLGPAVGISGVIQKPNVVHYQASDNTGDTDIDYVTDAIIDASKLSRGIQILNISSGFNEAYLTNTEIANLKTACMNFPGLIICSAGNTGTNIDAFKYYPASFDLPNIIVVGATNENDNKWNNMYGISNIGATSVDLFAPGTNILTTYPFELCNGITQNYSCGHRHTHYANGYHTVQGTSFAAPQVTGVAAMIKALRPSFTTAQIKAAILDSVDQKASLSGLCVTGGRLNANKALRKAAAGYSSGTLEDGENGSGWAWNSLMPNVPIDVHVYIWKTSTVNKTLSNAIWSSQTTAGIYRSDLAAQGKGNGCHGFQMNIPWSTFANDNYTVSAYAVDGSGNNPQLTNIKTVNVEYYTLTLYDNDGTNHKTENKYKKNTPVQLSSIERSGYLFEGWAFTSGPTMPVYLDGESITITNNITLYAVWYNLNTYTVTYDANGGSGTMPVQTISGGFGQLNANIPSPGRTIPLAAG